MRNVLVLTCLLDHVRMPLSFTSDEPHVFRVWVNGEQLVALPIRADVVTTH